MKKTQTMEKDNNKDNMFVITEQGDLDVGTKQLTDEEQEKVNKQQEFYRMANKPGLVASAFTNAFHRH